MISRLTVLLAFTAACSLYGDDPTGPAEPDAGLACVAPEPPSWLGVQCRVLCGSPELGAPALCPGTSSFGSCWRECFDMAPAGHYCPLEPRP